MECNEEKPLLYQVSHAWQEDCDEVMYAHALLSGNKSGKWIIFTVTFSFWARWLK